MLPPRRAAAIPQLPKLLHHSLGHDLNAGASVNLKGINDWTPAHMAAARDDVKALRIFIRFGADLSIRTNIDEHATPLEEARNLGKRNAAKFLEDYSNGSND
jgi:ankyrin repeat protein